MLKGIVYKPGSGSPRLGSPKGEPYSQSSHRVKGLNFSVFSPSPKRKDLSRPNNQNQNPTSTSLNSLKTAKQLVKEEQKLAELEKKLKDIQKSYQRQLSEVRTENEIKYKSCLQLISQLEAFHQQKKKKINGTIKSIKSETFQLQAKIKQLISLNEKVNGENKKLRAQKQEYVNRLRIAFQKQQDKEEKLLSLKCQLQNSKDVLEYYQRLQTKEKKKIKELAQILDNKLNL